MTHTPAPWSTSKVFPSSITNGERYLFSAASGNKQIDEANAERIVACVNACEGIEDPAKEIAQLKARVGELEKLEAKYVRLTTDSDLANAIKGQEILWQMIDKPQP